VGFFRIQEQVENFFIEFIFEPTAKSPLAGDGLVVLKIAVKERAAILSSFDDIDAWRHGLPCRAVALDFLLAGECTPRSIDCSWSGSPHHLCSISNFGSILKF
jgi:hypothetical protein